MKRRTFIKTGLLFIPTVGLGQSFPFFAEDAPSSGPCSLDAAITNWAGRVVTNGGAAPSSATKCALNTFYLGLSSAGILSKMISVNCFVPDNLIASITPLIKVAGLDPWTNANFISGDLTVNGLKGNGSNRWLNTGVNPSTDFANSTSVGLTVYNPSDNSNACEFELSCDDGIGGNALSLYHSCGGTDYFDSYDTSASRISGSDSSFLGYISANRTASNATAIYKANSSTSHVAVATGSGSGGTRPNVQIGCFVTIHSGSPIAPFSAKRLSYAAIHLGLTSGESSTHYNLVQAMRTDLGGGAV